ncbi:MAG: DUF411 domain-containing protein [Pseudomonadota bacterium]|nr:DUF411 domain-containing protein [Pseudomonadota bacterium]
MKINPFSLLLIMLFFNVVKANNLPIAEIYKSPSCGCCSKWVDHLKDNGFEVITKNKTNMSDIKKLFGVPQSYASCHTAIIGDYVIEGHIPAENILDLLQKKTRVKGLTVPGMPLGSPGMESSQSQDYVVYSFNEAGEITPFAEHKK